MIEFTGERVIPGQVDPDLWNEHQARYEFAARFAAHRRVLDAGCGSGYGTARLAEVASSALGIDFSPEAIQYARNNYGAENLRYAVGSCEALPVASGSVDLIVCFEVLEHLARWQESLADFRRVLAPEGLIVISTPNEAYYAESRKLTGPNPYHVHEFDFAAFAAELNARFRNVSLYSENHVAAIAFRPCDCSAVASPELEHSRGAADPESAHFFVAVCGDAGIPAPNTFLYVPSTANVLRERELHIDKLETDLAGLRLQKQELVEMFRLQKAELDRSNEWAADLDQRLKAVQARVVELQGELAQTISGYEAKVSELDSENRRKAEWAAQLEGELRSKGEELVKCVGLLDTAEKTIIERTAWAQDLESQLSLVRASRWVKLGNRLNLGPQLPEQ